MKRRRELFSRSLPIPELFLTFVSFLFNADKHNQRDWFEDKIEFYV
jgi:hypothetical protein